MAPHSSPPSPPRRPLPQPVEESSRSSRNPTTTKHNPSSPTKTRRPLPEPVATSSKTSKKGDPSKANMNDPSSRDAVDVKATSNAPRSLPQAMEPPPSSNPLSPKPRKFAPQMIETSRRSRRNTGHDSSDTDTTPSASPALGHSTPELSHIPHHAREDSDSIPPENARLGNGERSPQASESKFSSSRLAEKTPRKHSFRVPDLPVISSRGSNDSNESLTEAAYYPGRGLWRRRKGANKRGSQARESQDESTSGYLLSLAAKAAEKQLKEQVMAAYPNENLHEPVDHYAGDRDSEEDSDVETGVGQLSMHEDGSTEEDEDEDEDAEDGTHQATSRQHRDSGSGEGGWGLAELRKHRDKLEQQKRDAWESQSSDAIAISDIGAGDPNAEFHQRGANAAEKAPVTDAAPQHWQNHNELKSMAKAASPPMAGQNLRFPRCQSPRNTRLDVLQHPGQSKPTKDDDTKEGSGLWTPKGGNSRQDSQMGLWMGVNARGAQEKLTSPMFIQSGLMTPAVEPGDPLSPVDSKVPSRGGSSGSSSDSSYVAASSLPPSPPSSQEEESSAHRTAKKLRLAHAHNTKSSAQLEDELDDAFVTQVYNYLSLGYPSLARPYDEELAKISLTDIETLRKDDQSGNSKGYIGAPEGTGLDVRVCREGACERWLALRKYVREWGRQQSLLGARGWEGGEMGGNDAGGWGARARKGSWAI